MEQEEGRVPIGEAIRGLPEDSYWKGFLERAERQFPESSIPGSTLASIQSGDDPKKGEVYRQVTSGEGPGKSHVSVANSKAKAGAKYGTIKPHKSITSRSDRSRW